MTAVDLVTFLLARLDELERGGPGHCAGCTSGPEFAGTMYACDVDSVRAFVLADVAAKRLLLDYLDKLDDYANEGNHWAMPDTNEARKVLAAPFASHPDFNSAWSVEA